MARSCRKPGDSRETRYASQHAPRTLHPTGQPEARRRGAEPRRTPVRGPHLRPLPPGLGESGGRPELHLSSQNPEKQAGAHAYSLKLAEWQALLDALEGRTADVMVEAKGKEHALVPLGVEF